MFYMMNVAVFTNWQDSCQPAVGQDWGGYIFSGFYWPVWVRPITCDVVARHWDKVLVSQLHEDTQCYTWQLFTCGLPLRLVLTLHCPHPDESLAITSLPPPLPFSPVTGILCHSVYVCAALYCQASLLYSLPACGARSSPHLAVCIWLHH